MLVGRLGRAQNTRGPAQGTSISSSRRPHTSRPQLAAARRGRGLPARAAGDDDAAAAAQQQPLQPQPQQQPVDASSSDASSSSSSSSSSSRAREMLENMPKAYVSEDEWRQMDKKVNKYPSQRTFTAIGTGGDDFAAAMCAAVADVVGTVHVECVSQRPSSGGKYLSVRVGPVWVTCGEQVIAVFNNMRKDARLKWYM